MTNLELAIEALGWQGGTLNQAAEALGTDRFSDHTILTMPQDEFRQLLNERIKPDKPKLTIAHLQEMAEQEGWDGPDHW